MAQIFETIKAKLLEIEKEENVRIFYACESGSRAWGFPSVNSDYDVRFLYIREQNFYLSIDVEDKRDVIEVPIDDELDINGWDLRKALRLLRKSNPPLLEWLSSPTVYLEEEELIKKFRSLVPLSYSPTACMYHYMQMARNSFKGRRGFGEEVFLCASPAAGDQMDRRTFRCRPNGIRHHDRRPIARFRS